MNWLILIGNDHSQTIENAELARNARRYCQNYTRILTLSSKAQTLLPVQEHGRLAGHGLSGCLYYLDQSQLCLLSLELYWQTRKQQHPLHSAACSFSRVPIFPKTAFKALPQIGPSSSRLMRHGVVRMPSSYPESLCSPSLPPTVRFRGMGTSISEANKRVPNFSFATQEGKQVSSYFRQRN